MRPAKEFPAAREHFGETSTFELSFPHGTPSNIWDAISKAEPPIEPRAYHTGLIQTYNTSLLSVSEFSSSPIVM